MHLARRAAGVLAVALFPLLTACDDPGAIAYQQGGDVHWAGLENVPPGTVTNTKLVTSLGSWNLEHMRLAPNGGWLALAERKNTSPSAGLMDARVRVFNSVVNPPQQVAEWDEAELKALIEDNADLSYPAEIVDFNPIRLRWRDNAHLIIDVQPFIVGTSIESLPENVALVLAFQTGELTEGPTFYARGASSPVTVPQHSQRTTYSSELRSGAVFVDGSRVNGVPTGIDQFDFVYLGG